MNLGRGKYPGLFGGFDWIKGFWRRGATKASSLPVVFCLGLLFLPASGLDVDSGDYVLFGGSVVVVCIVYERVFVYIFVFASCLLDCSILCISTFLCINPAHTSSVWVSAAVGLLLV